MIKLKYFLVIGVVTVLITACSSENSSNKNNFDHAKQAVKDNDSIVKFLKTHYFDNGSGLIKPLVVGEKRAIFEETNRLKQKTVTEGDINYTLYYYIQRQGNPVPNKGFPTVVDSVFAKYNGIRLVNSDSLTKSFDQGKTWFTLSSVIKGWTHSLIHFKGGKNITKTNEPITYADGGKGILFIPSGLGYRNTNRSSIPANSNLIFFFELWDHIEDTDHDNDNVSSIKEDLNNDGNPNNDDTDKDGKPNYLDTDDDGDGKPTKDEDANGDGDPTNDFSDKNNPTLPDYLNRKIF